MERHIVRLEAIISDGDSFKVHMSPKEEVGGFDLPECKERFLKRWSQDHCTQLSGTYTYIEVDLSNEELKLNIGLEKLWKDF